MSRGITIKLSLTDFQYIVDLLDNRYRFIMGRHNNPAAAQEVEDIRSRLYRGVQR